MAREDRELVPLGSAFDVVRRGYDRAQVDEHLERVDADLRLLAADRDAAVARAAELAKQVENQRVQIQTLQGELDKTAQPPTTLEGLSERLARMLRLAQDEAAEIRARAETETAAAIARAEADAGALRDRYQRLINELDERRVRMEAEHQSVMAKANAEAERLVTETSEQVRALEEESTARRRQIEEDFEIAMSSRRTEAMELLADQEAASKAEAERRVKEATAEANRRLREAKESIHQTIADAHSKVDQLRTVRAKIASQLREARSVLLDATSLLEPLAEEEPSAEPAASSGAPPTSSTAAESRVDVSEAAKAQPSTGREVAANRR